MRDTLTTGAIVWAVLTGLGRTLDWLTPPERKQALRDQLEPRLYKFRYLTTRSFGRAEIEFSLACLEAIAGGRLLSWRRWGCAASIYTLVSAVYWAIGGFPFTWGAKLYGAIVIMCPCVVLTALSLSFSIAVSRLALRIQGGTTIAGIILILLVHLLVFLAWQPLIAVLEETINFASVYAMKPDAKTRAALDQVMTFNRISALLKVLYGSELLALLEWLGEPLTSVKPGVMIDIYKTSFLTYYGLSFDRRVLETIMGAFSVGTLGTALVSNLLRIALGAYFIALAIYVRLFRSLIILIWSALLRPSDALFTPPLFAIGALVIVAENFRPSLYVLAHALRFL